MRRIVSAIWRFCRTSPGACTYLISIPLAIAGSKCCHGTGWLPALGICLSYQQQAGIQGTPEDVMEQVGFQLYRTHIGMLYAFLTSSKPEIRAQNYRNGAIAVAMVNKRLMMHCGSVMDSIHCFSRSLKLSTAMGPQKSVI